MKDEIESLKINNSKSLALHKKLKGKLTVSVKGKLDTIEDLSLMYSPGVSEPCIEILNHPETVYDYTMKSNTVGVITNGTAVLGLGNIGAMASIPVMEGKSAIFKKFANIDSFPICIDSNNPEKIIETIKLISPIFGGINLEDIKAPECFYIEDKLKKILDIPVFHDDQHGTAIVVLAGIKNALKVVNKKINEVKIVVNGIGAAGTAIINLLTFAGAKNILACDINGIIFSEQYDNLDDFIQLIAARKNSKYSEGTLSEALVDADIFIGVSKANVLEKEMVQKMNIDSIIFALANPNPEILPEIAIEAGAKIICTGRSDYPNQVNNVLAFPGVFRGALDVCASEINEAMKLAAVDAICSLIKDDELNANYIIPKPFDKRVVEVVSEYVKKAAIISGVARNLDFDKN